MERTRHLRAAVRTIIASLIAVVALGVVAPVANAYVYWIVDGSVGRSDTQGSPASIDFSFITGIPEPSSLTVDSRHLYWVDYIGNTIGRANLDGTGVDQSFITGASVPNGIAVDSTYIYWSNTGTNSIGRSRLDGTGVNQNFITGLNIPAGVAVDSNHIFWTSEGGRSIGRANLDGTSPNESLVSGLGDPFDLTLDPERIYWADYATSLIGRANLDGTGTDIDFLPVQLAPQSNYGVTGISVDSKYLYWTNMSYPSLGRAKLDGTGADQTFITGTSPFWDVAVDSLPVPTIGVVGNPTKTSVKVRVGCGDPSACSLDLTGKEVGSRAAVVPKRVSVPAGQRTVIALAYSPALRKSLARGGRISITTTNPTSTGTKSVTVRVPR